MIPWHALNITFAYSGKSTTGLSKYIYINLHADWSIKKGKKKKKEEIKETRKDVSLFIF